MTAALPRLLRTVRRRLAAAELVRTATRGAWWAGGATLVLGVAHRWWAALDPAAVAVVALAPPLLAVLFVAWRRRPSLETSARYVDRMFAGRELAVAGLEIARATPEPSATARLVAQRAERAAEVWLTQVPRVRMHGARGTVVALVLAAAGVFLLVNPSLAPPLTLGVSSTPAGAAAATVRPAVREVAPELAAAEARARPMTENETPGTAEPEGREPVPLLIPQLRAGVAGGPSQETGQLPATARASARPDGRAEPVAMEVRLIRTDAVDSAAQRAAGAGSVDLDATALREDALRAAPGTRNTAGLVTDLNRFAPAERRFLAAYFASQAERERAAAKPQGAP